MKYSKIETSHGKEDTYRMELPAVCVPVLENIVKEMSTLIEDKNMQEIFYYLSLGHDMREVSEKTGITQRNLAYIYRKAANIVHFNWKPTMQWKKELQHAHIKCRNYESLLTIPQIITRQSPRNFILVVRDQDIPTKYVDLLTIPLEKLDICLRTLRSLRKNNIYLLEDLLRFIKLNGFDSLAKLPGMGIKSVEQLYEKLKEKKILESKETCGLFRYLFV